MLEGRTHIARRLHVGADQSLDAAEVCKPIEPRACRGVFTGKQVMPGGLRVDLVNGSNHLARPVGTKPDMMPACGAKTRIMKNARARDH